MHQTVTAPVAAAHDRVATIIGDLATYPHWLDLVTAAAPVAGDDDPPAWLVTIRAKVGPFARSKKLRMVRTINDHNDGRTHYRFERQELDDRSHSAWTLDAAVVSDNGAPDNGAPDNGGPDSSTVTMDLRYDGGLWTTPLEPILGSFIAGAGPDLEAYVNRS